MLPSMTYTYTLTDHADENIRKQIVEPLVRFNEAQAGPATIARWSSC